MFHLQRRLSPEIRPVRNRRSLRPQLDALEGRTLLTTFTVSNTNDSGSDSLRAAIASANKDTTNDTIDFNLADPTSAHSINLSSTLGALVISKPSGSLAIQGPGANLLTVSGGGKTQVFQVGETASVSISGLTISGGSASLGGGLENLGTVTLSSCTLSGNTATLDGGGLDSLETATLVNCTISGNSASNAGGGVGSFDYDMLTMINCNVSGNEAGQSGGGLASSVTTTLTNCTISGNDGGEYGGGVETSGPATLTDCSLSDNKASGYGGGLVNFDTATLTNCTVSGNSAFEGGGLNDQATANLVNCTISGNAATDGGGLDNALTTKLTNTIVAGNTSFSGASDIAGDSNVSGGFNLIGAGGSGGLANGSNGNIVLNSLTGLGLAPLGNYGGPTETMALLPGSRAIDAGTSTAAGVPTTDQRGLGRVGATDIGAVESQGYTLTATGASQTAALGAVFASPLVVTVTPNNANDPVNGGTITFTAPASGASATLSASSATIAAGSALVKATANSKFGAYTVTADASGVAKAASFNLSNLYGTTTALASSANPAVLGQSVTFTATVTVLSPGTGTPTGKVVFMDGATVLATIALSGGKASFTTSTLAQGANAITATYSGDSRDAAGSPATLSQEIESATTVGLTSSNLSEPVGSSVTFTATVADVAPGTSTPTGTVSFYSLVGTTRTLIGTGTLSKGKATLTTSKLAKGTYQIFAVYNDDTDHAASTSSTITQKIV